MDLMELGAIGELVGGVAVIATIAFLGVQVRQGNRLAASSVEQANRQFNHEIFRGLSDSADVSRLFFAGLADRGALPREERPRFDLILVRLFRGLESQFLEHREGRLSDELFDSYARATGATLRQPGARASWQRQRSHMTPAFAAFVEERLLTAEETP